MASHLLSLHGSPVCPGMLPRHTRCFTCIPWRILSPRRARRRPVRGVTTASKQERHGKAGEWCGPPLNLPQTDFPMRANAATRELIYLPRCTSELYTWQQSQPVQGVQHSWTLHDGPPFANGDPHMGHVLNKVLKDIVNRYKVMRGYRVNYVPGWDCHGLPIELKALQQLQVAAPSATAADCLSVAAIRQAARAEALTAIAAQRAQFKRWGIMGDWDNAYLTMEPGYEACVLRIFRLMVERGLIYRALRPVHWSPSSMTALAEAELEYNEYHVSRAVYVSFSLEPSAPTAVRALETWPGLALVAWTTTPWSILANQALCIHPSMEYSVVQTQRGERLVVATSLIGTLETQWGGHLEIKGQLNASQMAGWKCSHPLPELGGGRPVLCAEHVTDGAGTGVVHTAPDHGHEDFAVGKKHGLHPLGLLDDKGCFTDAVPEWSGLEALDKATTAAIIEALRGADALIAEHEHVHSYPYDWRTKKPVLTRTTQQWFADLSELKDQADNALGNVQMTPERSRKRLSGMVKTRKEWCISRQRAWGVPIPVFYEKETGEVLLDTDTMKHVEECVAEHGTDCWWTLATNELLPPKHRNDGRTWLRGQDTLDVWFDSGVSWYAALQPHLTGQEEMETAAPASLCIEGSDQHRGWFQSSLLTSVATSGRAPYEHILSHGFVLDENGLKMSKSVGNVIDPHLVINGGADLKQAPAYGADVIRVWAASTDYTKDVTIGPATLSAASTTLRKLRNTARFALGNLYDFNPEVHMIPQRQLPQADRYLLHRLHEVSTELTAAYEELNFARAQKLLVLLATSELSAFYFDIVKTRVYCAPPYATERRAAQTVMYHALDLLTKALAPIAPFCAEDIVAHLPSSFNRPEGLSAFQTGWLTAPVEWKDPSLSSTWALRGVVAAALESARKNNVVGSALDAQVELTVHSGTELASAIESVAPDELLELLMVSSCSVQYSETTASEHPDGIRASSICQDGSGVGVRVEMAQGSKCARCWRIVTVTKDSLCMSCSF